MIEFKELFKAGVHFGHRTSRWAPQMAPYIWGTKNKIHLIDISKTSILLNRAAQFLKDTGKNDDKQILFVGTKKAAQALIKKTADDLNMPYVINRWIGGTLSNNDQVKKAITRLLHLQDVIKKSANYYTKKEVSMLRKEVARLEKNIGGIINFAHPPAALIVVDAKKEHAAVREALRLSIPVIAMVDTNTNPETINFVIPSNDDSVRSIECILGILATAFTEGRAEAEKLKPKKEVKAEVKTKAVKTDEIKEKEVVSTTQAAERTSEKATEKEAAEAVKESVEKASPKKVDAKPVAKKAESKPSTKVEKKVAPKEEPKKAAKSTEKKPEAKEAAKPKAKVEEKKAAKDKPVAKKETKASTIKKEEPKKAVTKPAAKKTTAKK